jgi:hypothetical protein
MPTVALAATLIITGSITPAPAEVVGDRDRGSLRGPGGVRYGQAPKRGLGLIAGGLGMAALSPLPFMLGLHAARGYSEMSCGPRFPSTWGSSGGWAAVGRFGCGVTMAGAVT